MYKYLCPYCHTEVHKEDWEEYYKCSNCKRKTSLPNQIRIDEEQVSCYSCKYFYYDNFCAFQCPACKKGVYLYNISAIRNGLVELANACKYYERKEEK